MIRLREATKQYEICGQVITVLNRVNLSVERGEFLSVIGRSGSGKSTLMNILGCLDRPCVGEYILDGENIFSKGGELCLKSRALSIVRNQKIGFVFQSFNLIPSLTARENIELPLIYRGTSKTHRARLVEEALEMVRLSDRRSHKPPELSGGQQQRVAIARAIAAKPPLILADEPCGNLDSRSAAEIMEIFKGLNQAGRTIVLITHDPAAAKQAKRIVSINDGKVEKGG